MLKDIDVLTKAIDHLRSACNLLDGATSTDLFGRVLPQADAMFLALRDLKKIRSELLDEVKV